MFHVFHSFQDLDLCQKWGHDQDHTQPLDQDQDHTQPLDQEEHILILDVTTFLLERMYVLNILFI